MNFEELITYIIINGSGILSIIFMTIYYIIKLKSDYKCTISEISNQITDYSKDNSKSIVEINNEVQRLKSMLNCYVVRIDELIKANDLLIDKLNNTNNYRKAKGLTNEQIKPDEVL